MAAIGAWNDLKVLRHYVGAEVLSSRLLADIRQNDSEGMCALMQEVITQLKLRKAVSAPSTHGELGFYTLHRPHKWHVVRSSGKQVTRWLSACGDHFNPVTMTIGSLAAKPPDDLWCTKCLLSANEAQS